MANWTDIGPASDYPADSKACIDIDGLHVVVMNVAGRYFVVANVCPHAGMPLGDGELRGSVLTCPYHGYAYNVETGVNIDFPKEERPVRTYAAREQDGRIEIDTETLNGDDS